MLLIKQSTQIVIQELIKGNKIKASKNNNLD